MHYAKAGGLHARHLQAAHCDIGAGGHMLLQHDFIVHFVDMIAGQNDDVVNAMAGNNVDILKDRIGGALIPAIFRDHLAGGQNIETFIALGAEEIPATLQMPDQAVGFILGGHADPPDAAIHGIGEGKIDDPRLAAKKYRRLGAPVGQFFEPRTAPASQHISHAVAG